MSDKHKRQQELSEAIKRFASTTRYPMLRALQVGRFISAEDATSVGVVSELTFEKLVELGSTKITKLRWLSKEQQDRLVTLLGALTDGDGNPTEMFVPRPADRSRYNATAFEPDEEVLSSVEVENRLRTALTTLKNHPGFERVANRPLGSFWDDSWARAPFEEAMTLEQLSNLDLAFLWKKRMITPRRIDRMAKAVQAAVDSLQPSGAESEPSKTSSVAQDDLFRDGRATIAPRLGLVPAHSRVDVISASDAAVRRHPWIKEWEGGATVVKLGIERFLAVALNGSVRADKMGALLATLADTLSKDDFVSLLEQESSPAQVTQRMTLWVSLPEIERPLALLRTVLQAPGVHISRIAALLQETVLDPTVSEIAGEVIIKILGASLVSVKGERCPGVWSLNPNLLDTILSCTSPVAGESVQRTLERTTPVIDPVLKRWVLQRLDQDSQGGASPPKRQK
jgi:hypothetical protein